MSKVRGDFTVTRNISSRNLSQQRTITTVSASTLTLNSFSSTTQIFTGSTAGQVLDLGDATGYGQDGGWFLIINRSDQNITIQDAGANLLLILQKNYSVIITLQDGSTANGTWTLSLFVDSNLDLGGFPRAGLPLVNNGSQNNNDWITYSNLTPDAKITFPVKTRINEVTFANSNSDVEFDIQVYKNGIAGGNLVDTWSFDTGPGIDFGSLSNIDLDLEIGDWIRLKYIDQGTNTSDLVLVVYFSRLQDL